MKRFLFLALALVGCVTNSEDGAKTKPEIVPGVYVSSDKSASLTIDYPNWEVSFLTNAPEAHISGMIDSVISRDTTDMSNGSNKLIRYATVYNCKATEMHGLSAAGTHVDLDSSFLWKCGFVSDARGVNAIIEVTTFDVANDSASGQAVGLSFLKKKFGDNP